MLQLQGKLNNNTLVMLKYSTLNIHTYNSKIDYIYFKKVFSKQRSRSHSTYF